MQNHKKPTEEICCRLPPGWMDGKFAANNISSVLRTKVTQPDQSLRPLILITSPTGAVAKYCDEYICMCLCVSLSVHEDISTITSAIFTNFLCTLPMAMAQSSSGRVTKFQGEGAVLRGFLLH